MNPSLQEGFFKLNHFNSCTSKSIIVPYEHIYKERL